MIAGSIAPGVSFASGMSPAKATCVARIRPSKVTLGRVLFIICWLFERIPTCRQWIGMQNNVRCK